MGNTISAKGIHHQLFQTCNRLLATSVIAIPSIINPAIQDLTHFDFCFLWIRINSTIRIKTESVHPFCLAQHIPILIISNITDPTFCGKKGFIRRNDHFMIGNDVPLRIVFDICPYGMGCDIEISDKFVPHKGDMFRGLLQSANNLIKNLKSIIDCKTT